MRKRIRKEREQNIEEFKIIVDHIMNRKEFFDGGCTNSEKDLLDNVGSDLFLGVGQREIVNIEIKLYKMWVSFKNKHE